MKSLSCSLNSHKFQSQPITSKHLIVKLWVFTRKCLLLWKCLREILLNILVCGLSELSTSWGAIISVNFHILKDRCVFKSHLVKTSIRRKTRFFDLLLFQFLKWLWLFYRECLNLKLQAAVTNQFLFEQDRYYILYEKNINYKLLKYLNWIKWTLINFSGRVEKMPSHPIWTSSFLHPFKIDPRFLSISKGKVSFLRLQYIFSICKGKFFLEIKIILVVISHNWISRQS